MTSISVVIPAYNAERFLGEALDSALSQDPRPAEILVVDDGSIDETAQIAASFGDSVILLRRENGGIGAARNTGLEHATAEFLTFLDADDVWPPGRLKALGEAFVADDTLDGAFGSVVEFGEGLTEGPPTQASLASSLLIRRASFERVGSFREDLRVGEFIDWYARAQEAGLRFAAIPYVVLRRRLHETNTGRLQRDARPDYVRVLRAALERRRKAAQND
jgi:glycosyltransferase involved in cell wall biosynthesis